MSDQLMFYFLAVDILKVHTNEIHVTPWAAMRTRTGITCNNMHKHGP